MLTVLFICDVQVAVMQQELTALQPELIETAKQTDQMMVKIEKETVEVDAKKELVSADEKVANEAAAAAKAIKVSRCEKCISVHQSSTFLSKAHKNNPCRQTLLITHQFLTGQNSMLYNIMTISKGLHSKCWPSNNIYLYLLV